MSEATTASSHDATNDELADDTATANVLANRIGAKLSARKLGIGIRLFSAFGAVAFLTIAASGIAWISFANVGDALQQVTGRSVPAMTEALRLSTVSAALSASADVGQSSRRD